MFELYKAECRRFRWWALGAGALHAGILLFFDRMVDPLQQPAMIYELVAAIYAGAGVLLGLFQAGSYARINQWMALLHRPLSPRRVLIAVAGGSATMLAAAVLVPILLLLIGHGLIGSRFVDARHWLLGLSGMLIALTGLMGGIYAALSPRRYGWLVLIPALLPTASMAVGWAAIVVQTGVLVALALLVTSAFKPDLAEPPRTITGLAGTALTAAMGAYLLLVVAGDLVFQTLWITTGTHPLNGVPPRGGVTEATRADGAALIEAGLAGRQDNRARLWREQVRLSEIFEVPPTMKWLPVRGELTNVAPMEFDDERRGTRWTFSHDDMRFHGVRLSDGAALGTLDVPGGFDAPPLPIEGGHLIAGGSLLGFDADDGMIHRSIRLPAGETIVARPSTAGTALAVMSDRALRLYDVRVLDESAGSDAPLATVPLPGPVGSLMRLDLIELLDGYLVSFTYARDGVDGPADAWQQIVHVTGAGTSRPVARRTLTPDFPFVTRFAPYWISPALKVARDLAEHAGSGPVPMAQRTPVKIPLSIWIAAGLLAALSAAVVALLARRWRLGLRASAAWMLATLALGPPMLFAFWLIRPNRTA
ncbi:hypothetical protein HNP52_003468 [Sphingomonas kyeonggiensis]|uniref:Uncharacterized protein n=1 Tax=Sphingomonas kyeonggiensis TaxID=1268553 RepID=A0A7W7NTX4_9SPHN|nr:hypothetical protein [Sphingomonas kyeonggiensis]MBB4840376.1 hypothetical protein [Sphingomonas kyeonggiensis]